LTPATFYYQMLGSAVLLYRPIGGKDCPRGNCKVSFGRMSKTGTTGGCSRPDTAAREAAFSLGILMFPLALQ